MTNTANRRSLPDNDRKQRKPNGAPLKGWPMRPKIARASAELLLAAFTLSLQDLQAGISDLNLRLRRLELLEESEEGVAHAS